jgi:hypothetical protein
MGVVHAPYLCDGKVWKEKGVSLTNENESEVGPSPWENLRDGFDAAGWQNLTNTRGMHRGGYAGDEDLLLAVQDGLPTGVWPRCARSASRNSAARTAWRQPVTGRLPRGR